MRRAQLPLSLVEVALGTCRPRRRARVSRDTSADRQRPQLDAYASDTAALLANDPPRHSGATRLQEIVSSPTAFDRERDALTNRVARILPTRPLSGRNTARRGRYADATGVSTGTARADGPRECPNYRVVRMTRRGQLVLVAATVVAVALVPILFASLQRGIMTTFARQLLRDDPSVTRFGS